jgi:hypothetical protein
MTFEDTLKQEMRELSADVLGGPDLGRAIETGRRRRRNRHVAVAAASTCVAAMLAATAFALAPGGDGKSGEVQQLQPAGPAPKQDAPQQHAQPKTAAPADYVSGTQVDEQLQTALQPNLPAGVAFGDVYASDWTRDTPLPDAQAENATDWEIYLTTGGADTGRVVIGLPVPYEDGELGCGPQADHCTEQTLADGSTLVTQVYSTGSTYIRNVAVQRPDTKTVIASDLAPATTFAEAEQAWSLDVNQLKALATTAGLDFPDPVVTPPNHR